ncbi:hypothetical protein ACN9M1_09995 [Ralstonia sp. R-29]|uniref:hypothetical protein n=1 Tax=Ralstonia sp. R-29 TaxID=3404059 RepID=UPI003CEAA1BC
MVVEHITFPTSYRRLCLIGRLGTAGLLGIALFWLIVAWGFALPTVMWFVLGVLTIAAAMPLLVNRSPLAMELMWRARLKGDGEPGQPRWQVKLQLPQAFRTAPLLWVCPLGERILILGLAHGGWCPQIVVLMSPWFAAGQLRRLRSLFRLGPPPLVSGVS